MKVLLNDLCEDFSVVVLSYQESPDIIKAAGLEDVVKRTDGLAFYFQETPVVLFNADKPVIDVCITVAHELGHLILGHLSHRKQFDLLHTSSSEREADMFAMTLLSSDILL